MTKCNLPHVWIPMSTIDFLAHKSPKSVNVAWIDNHEVPVGKGNEYVPATELEAAQRHIEELGKVRKALCSAIRDNSAEIQWPQVGMVEATVLDAIADELTGFEALFKKETTDAKNETT